MICRNAGIIFLILLTLCDAVFSQDPVDHSYIQAYEHPYVAMLSLQRAGAGMQISPDYTVIPSTASFPFNSGTNLALDLYYKFINLSISKSLNSTTNNKSFHNIQGLFVPLCSQTGLMIHER